MSSKKNNKKPDAENLIKSLFSKNSPKESDSDEDEYEYVYVRNAETQTSFVSSSAQSSSKDSYCDVCGQEFKNAAGLRIHISKSKKHKELVDGLNQPEVNKASLDEAGIESSGVSCEICEICKRLFKNVTGLKIHTSKVHKQTKNKI